MGDSVENRRDSESPGESDSLAAALARHAIDLPDDQAALVERYARLLWDWNAKINLTRHTDFEKFVGRDLVDTLALAELLETGERVLDVGTGGGVPGVPLAIVRPDVSVAVADSIGKKARVVEQIVAELGLEVPVFDVRVQDLLEEQQFDTLVARAVGPLAKILRWVAPHWGQFNRLLLIKGPNWVDERKEAREHGLLKELELRRRASYPMPGTESKSVILEVAARDA